jgi:hypothetical protein
MKLGKMMFYVETLPDGALAIYEAKLPEGCIRVIDEKPVEKTREQLWQEMADLTLEKCKATCKIMGSCCDSSYCEMAAESMQEAGVPVPEMPFVKDGKCVIPPHFRPMCTFHQCKISGLGFDPKDKDWTDRYFALRAKIEEMEYNRFNT